ncbi:hypothetical protein T484DRAFT_1831882, partial [Baffinella frigidus]
VEVADAGLSEEGKVWEPQEADHRVLEHSSRPRGTEGARGSTSDSGNSNIANSDLEHSSDHRVLEHSSRARGNGNTANGNTANSNNVRSSDGVRGGDGVGGADGGGAGGRGGHGHIGALWAQSVEEVGGVTREWRERKAEGCEVLEHAGTLVRRMDETSGMAMRVKETSCCAQQLLASASA